MDPETLVTDDTNTSHDKKAESSGAKSAFDASSWQLGDSTFLQPSNLAIPKVQRAWDRNPLSPFSRQRLRVGKVWKRPMTSLRSKIEDDIVEAGRATKRRKAKSSFQGPLKPVKKMCLSSDFGMGARVLQWDAAESPVRKIVTRSNTGVEEIVALPDVDDVEAADEEVDEDVTIEILDEDGTVLDVGGPDLAQEQEWVDEVHENEEDQPNEKLMHPERVEANSVGRIDAADAAHAEDVEADELLDSIPSTTILQRETVILPEGFISPAKQAIAPRRRISRPSLSSRRRTLPVQFAPVIIAEEPIAQAEGIADVENAELLSEPIAVAEDEMMSTNAHAHGKEDAWEDIEDEAVPDDTNLQSQDVMDLETRVSEIPQIDASTDVKLPSSPIPTIEGQHPRLPLRRSPRRKSSSPLKQSTILPSTERSHLIAFTPLKGPPTYPSLSTHPVQHNGFIEEEETSLEPAISLERAASAPPEEPQMSPHKPSRPRVSDDTALLQAFLNRAAEGKNSRRISATKRESITNRRDSDAVRQALASPAKEVLGDLDPNSPSPRKPNNAGVFDGVELGVLSQDEMDEARFGPTTRRGDRAAKRAVPPTPAAPNKIAIRGNAENVFIKRSEAQELAQLTRNNTRKNKGGAVLPPLRLTKLASLTTALEFSDADDEMQGKKSSGKRNIRWAETLVEFYQDGGSAETSVLSDELNGPAVSEPGVHADGEIATGPPAPAETPSKPKIRRLKPPRTAATPAKAPPPAEAEKHGEVKTESKEQPKPAPPTKRRSRIATPAKALKTAQFWTDLESEPQAQDQTASKKPAQKKKAPISKLPAPASSTTSMSTSTSSFSQGKENLISSPPKKRTVPTAKTFAPKLDFGSKTQLAPTAVASSDADVAVPGLASPAKKAKGRAVVFGHVPAPEFGAAEKRDELPGLSSPAKKRTRRAGALG